MQPRRRALALSALVLTATICTAPELCAQDGKAAVETAIMRVFEGMHTTSGTAYCWGENRYGALGDGTGINRTTPTPVLWQSPP